MPGNALKYLITLLAPLIASALASCDHKQLIYPGSGASVTEVSFDWANAPEANPEGMTVIFYPHTDGLIYRFDIAGRNGGPVKLPAGEYDVVAYNSDAQAQLIGDPDSFFGIYAYTPSYSAAWFSDVPPTRAMPDMMWSASKLKVLVSDLCGCSASASPENKIVLRPVPLCVNYKVEAYNIENLNNAKTIGATLSGMAWAMTLYDRQLYPNPASLPFLLSRIGETTMQSHFTPFGNNPDPKNENKLTIFATLKDGRHLQYEFDVTSQVKKAPDPRNVLIKVGNIKLPEINPADTIGNAGLDVNVDGWEVVKIQL